LAISIEEERLPPAIGLFESAALSTTGSQFATNSFANRQIEKLKAEKRFLVYENDREEVLKRFCEDPMKWRNEQ
jgi:hypothetical protein